jgi:hypothetical protein
MRYCRYLLLGLVAVGMLAGRYVLAQSTVSQSAASFPPLEVWKAEVLAGDPVALKAFYSTAVAGHGQRRQDQRGCGR